jgi:hypothetical protein
MRRYGRGLSIGLWTLGLAMQAIATGCNSDGASEPGSNPSGSAVASPPADPSAKDTPPTPTPTQTKSDDGTAGDPTTPTPTPAEAPADPSSTTASAAGIRVLAPDPTLAKQYDKAAWVHYRAGEFEAAAEQFALEAGVEPGHKPAHNLACAAARAGKAELARAALLESIARGGDEARSLARKDEDLASLREEAWFAAAVDPEPVPSEPVPSEPAADPKTGPVACPEKYTVGDEGTCYLDVSGNFTFTSVPFTQAITLDVEIPAKPASKRWVMSKLLGTQEIAEQLGLTVAQSARVTKKVPAMMVPADPNDTPFAWVAERGYERPFFWWPGDDPEPVLVIPLRIKVNTEKESIRVPEVYALALARKQGDGWAAFVVPGWTPTQEHMLPTVFVYSNYGLRVDQRELFGLIQQDHEDDFDAIPYTRMLCRIREVEGALSYACSQGWNDIYP